MASGRSSRPDRTRRRCSRSGCAAPATAVLHLRPALQRAWLVRLDVASTPGEHDLCSVHADTVTLPDGWRLHDERGRGTVSVRGVRRPGSTGRAGPPDALPARRVPAPGAAELVRRDPARAAGPAHPARDRAPDVRPDPVGTSDALGSPDASRTPLLARAFRNVRRH